MKHFIKIIVTSFYTYFTTCICKNLINNSTFNKQQILILSFKNPEVL